MASAKSLKILFVTSEVIPFMKTGGLADVSAALPQKLMELGHQVRIIAPKYGAIDERKHKIHEVVRLKDLTTTIGKKDVTFSLRSSFLPGQKHRVQIYFLDNREYFGGRHSLYTDPLSGKDFSDNDERFILLAKSVFYLINKLGWIPDIIHCNDWQTGLVPAYLKLLDHENENIKKIKTLFTIHNIALQGLFPKSTCKKNRIGRKNVRKRIHAQEQNQFLESGNSIRGRNKYGKSNLRQRNSGRRQTQFRIERRFTKTEKRFVRDCQRNRYENLESRKRQIDTEKIQREKARRQSGKQTSADYEIPFGR
jgi:starch synthase